MGQVADGNPREGHEIIRRRQARLDHGAALMPVVRIGTNGAWGVRFMLELTSDNDVAALPHGVTLKELLGPADGPW